MSGTLLNVGKYNKKYNTILNISLDEYSIVRSKGLLAHMINRKHFKALKYIDDIPDILSNPDYIGINPNEKGTSIEYVKCLKDNILLGVKSDQKNDYLYISTMYDLSQKSIERYIHSGRLKALTK